MSFENTAATQQRQQGLLDAEKGGRFSGLRERCCGLLRRKEYPYGNSI
jgi:hypothetical protein